MLRAWRSLATFEDRVGLRPWLYRIATNVCIDMLKGRARRALPIEVVPAASGELRRGDARPEATWIQPAPDSLVLPPDGDPAERVVSRESVRLAFIAALQHLAPRQRAVLILRDVLRWHAEEVAVLLETSADAVNSVLRRARAAVATVSPDSTPSEPSAGDRELLAAYIDAFERNDVDALVGLLPRRRHPRDAAVRTVDEGSRRHPALAARCRRPRTGGAHARRCERVTGRCRLPVAGAGRGADGVLDPGARRRRRAHQRDPRLRRTGAVRSVRPPLDRTPRR